MANNQAPIDESNADELAPILTLSGHSEPVTDAVFSPDGELIATSSEDGLIRLWRAADGELVGTLEGHTAEVAAVDFSADGELLVSGAYDRTAKLWSVQERTTTETIESLYMGYVLEVQFAPEGPYFLVADHLCDVQLRRAPTGLLEQSLRQPECVNTGGTVKSWGIDFSPDGTQVITGEGLWSSGGSIHRWNVQDAFEPPKLLEGFKLKVRDLEYSPSGDTLAVALLGSPVFWLMDAENGDLIRLYEGHAYRVNGLAFSARGDLLASVSRDPSLKIWPVDGDAPLATYRQHSDTLNSVAFSPSGDRILTSSDDGTAIVWGLP